MIRLVSRVAALPLAVAVPAIPAHARTGVAASPPVEADTAIPPCPGPGSGTFEPEMRYGKPGDMRIYAIIKPTSTPALPAQATATGDSLSGRAGYGLIQSWVDARHWVDLHSVSRGVHGAGKTAS